MELMDLKLSNGMDVKPSMYSRVFDSSSLHWVPDNDYNKTFIAMQERYCTDWLKHRYQENIKRGAFPVSVLYLNDVFDMLGMTRTMTGSIVGWVYDEKYPIGDNFVNFMYKEIENGIVLDFNVDGRIADIFRAL